MKNLINDKIVENEEVDYCQDMINNPLSFEFYCINCDNFNTEDCPFLETVNEYTKWKTINCTNFEN